jgi:hypothetical protein
MAETQDLDDTLVSLEILESLKEEVHWNAAVVWADSLTNTTKTYASLRFTKERIDRLGVTSATELKCRPLTVAMADDGSYRFIFAFYKEANGGHLVVADDKKEE